MFMDHYEVNRRVLIASASRTYVCSFSTSLSGSSA